MSTKSTLAYGDNFHLYRECFDDENVYLELNGLHFETTPGSAMVQIPLVVWEVIRGYSPADFSLVDKTDEELRSLAESYVQDRIDSVEQAEAEGRHESQIAFRKMVGMLVHGTYDQPRFEQLRLGVESLTAQRARQRTLRDAIESLRKQQRRRTMRFLILSEHGLGRQMRVESTIVEAISAEDAVAKICGTSPHDGRAGEGPTVVSRGVAGVFSVTGIDPRGEVDLAVTVVNLEHV